MNRQFLRITMAVIVGLLIISSLGAGSSAKASIPFGSAAWDVKQVEQPAVVVNDSENVELLGHLGGSANPIEVQGQYAYAGFGPELAVLDISDPGNIQRVGWVVAEGEVQDLDIEGDYAYISY